MNFSGVCNNWRYCVITPWGWSPHSAMCSIFHLFLLHLSATQAITLCSSLVPTCSTVFAFRFLTFQLKLHVHMIVIIAAVANVAELGVSTFAFVPSSTASLCRDESSPPRRPPEGSSWCEDFLPVLEERLSLVDARVSSKLSWGITRTILSGVAVLLLSLSRGLEGFGRPFFLSACVLLLVFGDEDFLPAGFTEDVRCFVADTLGLALSLILLLEFWRLNTLAGLPSGAARGDIGRLEAVLGENSGVLAFLLAGVLVLIKFRLGSFSLIRLTYDGVLVCRGGLWESAPWRIHPTTTITTTTTSSPFLSLLTLRSLPSIWRLYINLQPFQSPLDQFIGHSTTTADPGWSTCFSCCLGNCILLPKRLDRTIRLTISLHGRSSKGGFSLRRHFDRLLLKTRFQIRSLKTSRFLKFCLNSCHVYEWPQSLFCCSTPVNNSLKHSMVLNYETEFRKFSEFSINWIHFFHSFTQSW